MALTSKQKKVGIAASMAVGALALGGVAVSTIGSPSSNSAGPAPVAATATAPHAPATTPHTSSASGTPGSTSSAITITARTDNAKPADDTVFTVSGEVRGAQPGAEVRLQRQQASTPASSHHKQAWNTMEYTTFTDRNNRFSFPVKIESPGSYNLRVVHEQGKQDKQSPGTVYSEPFAVTVTQPPNSAAPHPTTQNSPTPNSTNSTTPSRTPTRSPSHHSSISRRRG